MRTQSMRTQTPQPLGAEELRETCDERPISMASALAGEVQHDVEHYAYACGHDVHFEGLAPEPSPCTRGPSSARPVA
eukprot:985374-Pyramimonas_sp.AAC.1